MKLTFKSPEIIARAVKAELTVHYGNRYTVTPELQLARADGSITNLRWPPPPDYVPEFFSYVSQDTEDFLAMLLFCSPGYWSNDSEADTHDKSVYDFAPEFVAAVEKFIAGFRETLDDLDLDIDLDVLSRSFGGDVYLSLSGQGAGFWDDSHPTGRVVHDLLVAYSGNRYRFEELYVSNDEFGLLDMPFIPSARDEYRNKTFKLL